MTTPVVDGLPSKFEALWPHQEAAASEIVAAFRLGADVVSLDAPTGSGKTVIAETVRQTLGYRGLYVCTTKSLQDQFAKDFPYSAVLKGRDNYPTQREELFHDGPGFRITAADCTKRNVGDVAVCDWCDRVSDCPYEQAKHRALSADLAVLNTAYYLTECNGPGRFSKRDFVVCDEADLLESELMRYCGLNISNRRMEQLKLKEPKYVTKEESWLPWVQDAIQVVQGAIKGTAVSQRQLFRENDNSVLREIRQRRSLVRLYESLVGLARNLTTGEVEWIYTGKNGQVSFKPITVGALTSKMLWQHSTKFLLMSATTISPSAMVKDDLGYDGSWYSVSVPSTFPKENRLVHYVPITNMGKKSLEENKDSHDKLARGIEAIIARHPGERVLVHTVSYDLTKILKQKLGGDRVWSYHNAAERDKAIREFTNSGSQRDRYDDELARVDRTTPTSSVLLAPSLDRGIDLPDDQCRVIIIAKIPYPYLGDRQVSRRLYSHGGRQWYLIQTIRSIVQMSGRGVRHTNDSCTTYILDSNFNRVWNEGRRYFPDWYKDAMIWNDRLL